MHVDEIRILLDQGRVALGQGRFDEALELVDRVLETDDGNEQAINLKGLVLFKQDRFGDAVSLFQTLVGKYPEDPTLLMNLGLAYLKSEQHAAAITELEKALKFKGDEGKIHNYLGLAYSGLGKLKDAQKHFESGGSRKMAEQMLALMGSMGGDESAGAGDDTVDQSFDATFAPAPAPEPEIEVEIEADEPAPEPAPEPAAEPASEPEPPAAELATKAKAKPKPESAPEAAAAAAEGAVPTDLLGNALHLLQRRYEGVLETLDPGQGLTELGDSLLLERDSGALIDLARSNLIRVRSQPGQVALGRARLLFATMGDLKAELRRRRYKGKDTKTTFGGDESPVCEFVGEGSVWLALGEGQHFQTVRMSGELLYVLETSFTALAGEWRWENGQLPGAKSGEIHVVQLRGDGMLALRVPKGFRLGSIRLQKQKLALPATRLAGWYGNIVPVLGDMGLPADLKPGGATVQFQGDGTVLVYVPVP